MTRTALVVSPHLDDAAFSCGGTMALLADAGWRVVMATVFTRSVHPAHGFALACQTDKGLPPEVDYMALRRAEDREAAAQLGVEARMLDLPEAPHRGYEDAPALFGTVRTGDDVWVQVVPLLQSLAAELQPSLVLCCQGLGNHVDHRQVIRAAEAVWPGFPLVFYRDTPYAIRNPGALHCVTRPDLAETRMPIGPTLSRKVAASCAYGSQLGFQFGGTEATAAALRGFAVGEGEGVPAERFLGPLPTLS